MTNFKKKIRRRIERHTAEKLHSDNLAVGQLESLNLLSFLFVLQVARFAIPKLPPAHRRQLLFATFLVKVIMVVMLDPVFNREFVS